MGLKIAEAFKDKCFITVEATGLPATLLADVTCVIIDESGNRAAGVVTEESNGWYTCPFTPDIAGTWATEWSKTANPELYVFHYPYKEFQVGAGQEADIYARIGAPAGASIAADILAIDNFVDDLEGLHDVPAQNDVTNTHLRDVVGNKTDDPSWFTDDTSSLMKFAKAGVSTGGGLTYSGKCDAGMAASTITIVSDDLKGFGDDFFNTDWVMIVNLNDNSHGSSPEGDAPRDITDYVSATGTFTVTAFGANVEANDKIVVARRGLYTTDAIGLKTTPATSSLAYRLSQFLADGDGDFQTGTALPANTSLYDIIAGGNGHPAFPAAAAPANGVSLAEVLHLVADRTEHHVITQTFFSAPQETLDLHAVAANETLPSVVIPNITGTIVSVYAGIMFMMKEATAAGVIGVDGAQHIQVQRAGGAYVDAISIPDHYLSIADSTREGGGAIIGDHDIVAQVNALNLTCNFQWTSGKTHADHLRLSSVQTFLIVTYY